MKICIPEEIKNLGNPSPALQFSVLVVSSAPGKEPRVRSCLHENERIYTELTLRTWTFHLKLL